MKHISRKEMLAIGLSLFILPVIGCGGGGGDIDPQPTPTPTPTPTPGGGSYRLVSLVPESLMSKNTRAHAITADGTLQGGVSFTTTADPRALVWNSSPSVMVDMGSGEVRALEADVQIGFTGTEGMPSERACLWRGSEASRVELHPAGYVSSHAVGGDATVQVGRARPTSSESHAIIWRGTAASAVDLHPTGYTLSRAYDGDAATQVGNARLNGLDRALLWRGTAGSVVDLGPGVAWAVSGDTQIGQGQIGSATHALLWRGTEASKVDLHPAGFEQSRAFGVNGNWQVGYGDRADGTAHALVWQGTAASVVDLHAVTQTFLIDGVPPRHSFADAVDANGNVVGSVRSATGRDYAVMWVRN